MQTISPHGTFEEAIAQATPELQQIARQLRALIGEVHPDAVEVPWPVQQNTAYGVGPKKMTEHYAYIGPQSQWVNLGFMYGAALPDPTGLLEGTGKNLRHVKVRTLADIERPALRHLLVAAVAERKHALALP